MKKALIGLVIGAVVGLSVGYTVAQVAAPSQPVLGCSPGGTC